jgi:TRAP-type C4-dicarboxylate transport system permease large subunit
VGGLIIVVTGFIISGASYLSTAMSFTGIPQTLAKYIVGLDLSVYGLLFIRCLLYIFLGCFFDNYLRSVFSS